MSEKKSGVTFGLVIAALLVILGVGYFLSLGPVTPEKPVTMQEETTAASPATGENQTATTAGQETPTPMPGDQGAAPDTTMPPSAEAPAATPATTAQPSTSATLSPEEVEQALSERVLGSPDAPIRILENSSLTCAHCGRFHQTTFKTFVENYVKTNKAYVVFSDFPLNTPALHASMVARCLPQEKYFDFVQNLFEDQAKWMHSSAYVTYLKTKASENGLSEEKFTACLQSKELQDGILKRLQASKTQFDIKATPSFVVNNKIVVRGALGYDEFARDIENAVQGIAPPEPAPHTHGAAPAAAPEAPVSAPATGE